MTDIVNVPSVGKPEVLSLHRRTVVGLRERVAVAELAEFFARAIPAVLHELDRQGLAPAGSPVAMYRDERDHRFEVTVGFPIGRAPSLVPGGPLVVADLPGGRAVCAEHVSPYETMTATYAALSGWFAEHKLAPPPMMWEEYLVGPGEAADTAYHTRIIYPLA
jgi:effector-binding domain-containing protein